MTTPDKPVVSSGVRSLERGLQILSCFCEEHRNLTLTQIAERTELSTSTVERLLKTMTESGYLEKNSQKKYTLGRKMHQFMELMSRQE